MFKKQKLLLREYADWEHRREPGRWKPVSVPFSGKSLLSCSSETFYMRVRADGFSSVTGNWYPAHLPRTSNRWLKRFLKAFVLFGTKAFFVTEKKL